MADSPESASERCAVCPLDRAAHDDPAVHHLFSADGQLRGKPKPEPVKKTASRQLAPEQAAAARLAVVLQRRGIIDESDLSFVLMGVPHDAPPSPDGADPARTRGGWRPESPS